jgi:hypothetical protein
MAQSRSIVVLALAACVLGACHQAKSPGDVAKEVATAQDKADAEVARVQTRADKDVDSAVGQVGDKLANLNNHAATDAYKIALAQADGDRKVTLAQCDALSGDAQVSCKKQASADYDAAKANARAAEQAEKQ